MSESDQRPANSGERGASPLRPQPPEVTRLNRNALFLVLAMAGITILVAVTTMNSSRGSVAAQADSASAHVPISPQRPALPPLRVIAPTDTPAKSPVGSPVPPAIAFDQRTRESASAVESRGAISTGATEGDGRDEGYRRALRRRPIIVDPAVDQAKFDTASTSGSANEPNDRDNDRSLSVPLTRVPDAVPDNGRLPVSTMGALDASAASERVVREHRRFLAEARNVTPRVAVAGASLQSAPSAYELAAGTAIDAALVTDVNSDLPGTVVAQVTRDVFDSQRETTVLVPRGARLIGQYDDRIVGGQSRVLVVWMRLLFPDGRSVDLPGVPATDARGATGLPGNINSHLLRVFEDAAVLSVLSAGAELSQPNAGGGAFNAPSVGQTIGAAAGAQLASLGTEMVRQGLSVKPTIVVPAGAPVAVLLAEDLLFASPYGDQRQ